MAIARQCAAAGRRTLLVEQNDFASGTTSRSTRIIHGGLRYLEHGEIGLVRESLRERERLLRTQAAPGSPDALPAGAAAGKTQRARSPLRLVALSPLYAGVAAPQRPGDDIAQLERVARSTGSAGASSITRTRSASSPSAWLPSGWRRRWPPAPRRAITRRRCRWKWPTDACAACACATGWMAPNIASRRSASSTPSGPWADGVARRAGIANLRMIGGVRGSHLVLPRFSGAPESAVYTEALDGRPIFVIPWNRATAGGHNRGGRRRRSRPHAAERGGDRLPAGVGAATLPCGCARTRRHSLRRWRECGRCRSRPAIRWRRSRAGTCCTIIATTASRE